MRLSRSPILGDAATALLGIASGGAGLAVSASESGFALSSYADLPADGSTTRGFTFTARNAAAAALAGKSASVATETITVSLSNSYVTVSAATVAANTDVTVTVGLRDASNRPIPDIDVSHLGLSSSGTGNTFGSWTGRTDQNGEVSRTFQSSVGEAKTITATAFGQTITDTGSVVVEGGSGATILIDARWPDIGDTNAAIASAGQLPNLIDGNDGPAVGDLVMQVVANTGFGWTGPPVANVLQMTMDAQNYGLIQNLTALAAATDWYSRIYINVLDANLAQTNHPYKTDWRGSNSLVLWSLQDKNFGAGTYRPSIRLVASKWVDPTLDPDSADTIEYKGPTLNYNTWYRFEHRITFVGDPSLGRGTVDVRVYNPSDTLIATSADYVHTQWDSPFNTYTLAASRAAGAYYQATNTDGSLERTFRSPAMGYEGPASVPSTAERYLFHSYAAGIGGWLGAV